MAHLGAALSHRHLPVLDGLRAVAVFTVITYHFGFGAVPGDLGVSAFFVLSGFLITWLLLKEHHREGDISIRRFYLRRVLRIFPAYYVFLLGSFLVDHLRGQSWSSGLRWSGLLYLVNYYNALNGHPVTSISHAWSLGIEEQFYLLWPLALLLLLRQGGRARASLLLAVIIGAVVAWRSYLFLSLHVGSAYVYNAFDTRFDNLAVGCLLALCAERPWVSGLSEKLAMNGLLPLGTAGVLLLSRTAVSTSYHYTIGFTVDALLIAVLIVQLLQLYEHRLWRWLEHPVTRYLGVISYPLYLWHQWGLGLGHRLMAAPVLVQFGTGVAACVAVASGSYYLVERPFLRLKDRLEQDQLRRAESRPVSRVESGRELSLDPKLG